MHLICPTAPAKYFSRRGWTENNDLPAGQAFSSMAQDARFDCGLLHDAIIEQVTDYFSGSASGVVLAPFEARHIASGALSRLVAPDVADA